MDVHQKLIASVTSPTRAAGRKPEEVLKDIGERALQLLDSQGIAMDQCIGAGVGAPGTVDGKKGVVRYSNNIQWEQVRVAEEIGKILPVPVKVANDADCAALGEMVAGAGRGFRDMVMLTLGTGVGGGIILNGEIYEGKGIGGSELGHMVIAEDGEPCTCGRKGCLEAYASASALARSAERKTGRKDLKPEQIFELAERGDKGAGEAIEDYRKKLATGIVNIVNIFRPQLGLIGGGISAQGENLLPPLREIVKENAFGGSKGEIPEIETASLGNHAGMIGAANLV